MEKIQIKQPIIVEGKYDKIKLDSFVDGLILCSNGFRIFKDKEKLALIRRLAKDTGIIILTDSDVAGFKLRSFIKQAVKDAKVINIYIPQVEGKEKRKIAPSKQGFLGVEGINIEVLRKLFLEANVLDENIPEVEFPIVKMDLFSAGFIGQDNSTQKRQDLLIHLGLPTFITTKSLLDIINRVMTREQYEVYISSMKEE